MCIQVGSLFSFVVTGGGILEGSGRVLLPCMQSHMTSMGGRGRQGASRATAEFGLSPERCTLAGDDSYTHTHTSHTVSVLHTGRESVCAWVHMCVMCAFGRKKLKEEGVNVFCLVVFLLLCVHVPPLPWKKRFDHLLFPHS